MSIPDKFQWLESIGTLPKLVSAGLQYLGVKEIPGVKNNPVIMDMARGLGISNIYRNDELAWCGLFISHLFRITGKPPLDHKGDKYNILRAKAYQNWGQAVPIDEMQLGDLVVLERQGGGHVFILLAQTTEGNPIGIGGNQSNSVSIAEFKKERIIAVRRYYAIAAPASAKKYIVSSSGLVSTNEA